MCKTDKQHQQSGCGCGVDKVEELTEHAIINMLCRCGEMTRVVDVVRTVCTFSHCVCNGLVMVQAR